MGLAQVGRVLGISGGRPGASQGFKLLGIGREKRRHHIEVGDQIIKQTLGKQRNASGPQVRIDRLCQCADIDEARTVGARGCQQRCHEMADVAVAAPHAADRFGICSNVRFSFLAQWLWRQIGHVVPVSEMSPFTTPVLTWRVLGIFGEPAFVAAHPPLAGYLRQADDVMRYELAARTATLLEHYLTYRPDWLAAWLAGKPAGIRNLDAARRDDERWQAALWRRIAGDLGTDSRHPSVAFFDAMKAMGPDAPARAGLPAAAHVFCLPTTPPLYLDILHRLAQWIDLRLYVLNPCREYWFEIVDRKRLSWLAAEGRAEHHEGGHRLLAAWGKQTQAHIDLLLQDDSAAGVDDALFAPSEGDTLLAQGSGGRMPAVDEVEWTEAWRGARPGDQNEVFVLYRRAR